MTPLTPPTTLMEGCCCVFSLVFPPSADARRGMPGKPSLLASALSKMKIQSFPPPSRESSFRTDFKLVLDYSVGLRQLIKGKDGLNSPGIIFGNSLF